MRQKKRRKTEEKSGDNFGIIINVIYVFDLAHLRGFVLLPLQRICWVTTIIIRNRISGRLFYIVKRQLIKMETSYRKSERFKWRSSCSD